MESCVALGGNALLRRYLGGLGLWSSDPRRGATKISRGGAVRSQPVEGSTVELVLSPSGSRPRSAARRCPLDDEGTPDPEAFKQLHQMLAECYPLVHQKLKREVINGYSLLYTWQGTRPDLEPVMLMAHQDVVSADPADWTHPPFEARSRTASSGGAARSTSRTS